MSKWVSCNDLRKAGALPEGLHCCESCHDDYDEGWSDLCSPDAPDDLNVQTCCTVADAVRKQTVDWDRVREVIA